MAIAETQHDDGVLELVLDNPPVNSLTIDDLHRLAAILDSVEARPEVRSVVLRGEGKGFCGGGDVKEVQALHGSEGILGQASGSQAASLAIADCAVPVVAGVHGYCVGVGVLLVGTADIVVASRDTSFVLAEVDNGATSGAVQASGLLPPKRLRAAMFTAETVSATELFSYGSVYRLDDDVAMAARELAGIVASKSPAVVRRMKRSINASTGVDELRSRYRQELSYTYELNLMGEASQRRDDFVSGRRSGYLDRS